MFRPPFGFKIISGGQTGADRAALDWAITHGVAHGGWCPKGRRAEDGTIPSRFMLAETPSANYLQRTEWNVRDSDVTLIFTWTAALTSGSERTARFAVKHRKPCLHVTDETAPEHVAMFLAEHRVRILNVAGSRESSAPGIGQRVTAVLDAVLDTAVGRG